jgi:hypothetical protein
MRSDRDEALCYLAAANSTGNVRAATVCLSASDINVRPSPVRASRASTDDDNVVTARGNGISARNVLDGKVSNGDTASSCSLKVATVVVLLNENTVSVISN